jgi:hypothetical protein
MYVHDVCIAEAKELAALDTEPAHEVQVYLEGRLEQLVRETMNSVKWPVEAPLAPEPCAMLREVNVRRQMECIKSSPDWDKWQRRLFGRSGVFSVRLMSDASQTDRRRAVDAYIEEVREAGKRITRTDIWKTAGDKSRAEFERWQSYWYERRNEPPNKAADQRFKRILRDKPHLK